MHKHYFVATGIIRHKGRMLILRKASDDYSFPGRWSFCSGYVKEFQSAEDTVIREAKEETGLDVTLTSEGTLIRSRVRGERRFVVMAFFCDAPTDEVTLCHENDKYAWIAEGELDDYDFVPGLIADLRDAGMLRARAGRPGA